MLLVHADNNSPRFLYVLSFVLTEQCGISYRVSTDMAEARGWDGPLIWYSVEAAPEKAYRVPVHGLLWEKGVHHKNPALARSGDLPVLFPGEGDHGFDVFSAVFYLLSRYEEYLPYEPDEYLRFPHRLSIAYREGFLDRPLVNEWVNDFTQRIKERFPSLPLPVRQFRFLPTYDIDIAWSYRHKGFLRNAGGMLRRPSLDRLKALAGLEPDPYDSYELLDQIHDQYALSPIYFFLISSARNRYDKNIDRSSPAMKELIRRHAARYQIGAHPSWSSHDGIETVVDEIAWLSDTIGRQVTASRQHYIRMTLPGTYRQLIKAGITDDYSMGYGSINGFRASVASSFYWYDLSEERQTGLRLHPFCFMDANAFFEQKQDLSSTAKEIEHYLRYCKEAGGTLISIYHNQFLGTDPLFAGWAGLYRSFIFQALQ